MQFVDGPIEWPSEPPSFDEVSRAFGGRVFSFAPQRHLDRAGVNVERTNGEISAIAVHYSVYVNPTIWMTRSTFGDSKTGKTPRQNWHPARIPGRNSGFSGPGTRCFGKPCVLQRQRTHSCGGPWLPLSRSTLITSR
jgi:hypothetical protein